MNDLKVEQQSGVISTNLDTIEAEIKATMSEYEGYTVTEDSIKADKKVLADLRKKRTELDDARKAVKKTWMKPYEEFEARCKKVIALVDEPIDLINTQLKMFDEERIAKKQAHIKELYDSNIEDLGRFLPYEKVIEANPKWNNVSVTDQDIMYELSEMKLKIKNDLVAIKALGSEIEDECIDTYQRYNNDLTKAIQRNSQYLSDKEKIAQKQAETKVEPKEVEAETKEIPIQPLDGFVEVERMHHFIVSEIDAEQVRDMLTFANITFREE